MKYFIYGLANTTTHKIVYLGISTKPQWEVRIALAEKFYLSTHPRLQGTTFTPAILCGSDFQEEIQKRFHQMMACLQGSPLGNIPGELCEYRPVFEHVCQDELLLDDADTKLLSNTLLCQDGTWVLYETLPEKVKDLISRPYSTPQGENAFFWMKMPLEEVITCLKYEIENHNKYCANVRFCDGNRKNFRRENIIFFQIRRAKEDPHYRKQIEHELTELKRPCAGELLKQLRESVQ